MSSTEKDKFIAMIGFAKRAGKIVFGIDKLKVARGVKLLAVSDTASDNLSEEMRRLAQKRDLPLVVAAALEDTVGNNVKALGITDPNMASAMWDHATHAPQYKTEYGLRR